MVCLADPAVRNRARRDIKNMIEQRLTYRKETLLRDEIPPIPNVRRTPKELSKSPVYKRTKTMIPRRINKILVNKSRQVFNETSTSPGSPERTVTINTTYLDSDHDFGYYNRTKRKKSTTIQDLTLQLKETRRLLDVLKESEEVPEVEETSRDKPVRRKIEMEPGKRRPEPKVADFVSAKELNCESIGSESELELSPRQASPGREEKFGVKSSYQEEDPQEFEQMERSVSRPFSKRSHSGGSTVLNESDPFTDSDYMELGVNLQEELDISKEYESDAFSMCSEKISHMEARKMLSESEKRFSAMLDSLDQDDPDDSFLENERLMQQHSSKLDDILSIPSSVEDLRFDKEELPLLTRSNSDTGSTVTDQKADNVMVPVRQNLQDRPALKFSKQAQGDGQGMVLQPTPIKPIVKKPIPDAKAKENIDFKNYESDLNEIENLLFKYDEYRLEQEQKKSEKKTEVLKEKPDKPASVITKAKTEGTNKGVKDGQTKKISDGIVKSKAVSPPKTSVVSSNIPGKGTSAGIKTGIAKGTTTKMITKKPLVAPKPASSSKVSTKPSPTKNTKIFTLTSPGKTVTKSQVKDASPKKVEGSAINKSAGIKTATKIKPSSASGDSPSKILPPKKVSTTAKTESKDSPDKKLSKVAVSPSKVTTKTKTTSPAKIVGKLKPASMLTTSPAKKPNVSGPSSTTEGDLKPPSESVKKPTGSTIRPSPPKKLTKLTPASSLGKSKGNYVKSAMMATTKPPANDDNGASGKVDPSKAAEKDASSVKKASANTTKTVAKSSPTKVTSNSKISSPKSKVSPVKLSAGVKSTIPKPNSSATVKTVKPSSTLQKPKSSAEEKKSSIPTSKPAVSMKPEKSDLPSKPSIASKLASSVSSSSKPNPVPKASGLVKPSATKVAAPKSTSQTAGKDVKTNPVKTTSKLSPKKEMPAQKVTASNNTPTDSTQEKASSAKESMVKKTVPKPVSKLPPQKATSTPIKRTEQTTKSNLSPTKSKSSTTANVSPVETSISNTKSSTSSSKSPSKSSAVASPATSKSSAVASPATSKSSAATPTRSNSATIKSPMKSTLLSPKTIKKPSETSKTTAAAKKSVQSEVVTGPESVTNKNSSKSNDKSQPKVKSPVKAISKIPSPSKSSVAKVQSVDKSQPSKASVIPNAKSPSKPEVSPKPKIKSLTRTSSAKTIPKPKPVMRF